MVQIAELAYTAGMDGALPRNAHARLGTNGGNALAFSLHIARRVERRANERKPDGDALREIDAALCAWSREFAEVARFLAQDDETPEGRKVAVEGAERAADCAEAASAAGHRAGVFKREPGPVVHIEITEEDRLLMAAADQDCADILLREEARLAAESDEDEGV